MYNEIGVSGKAAEHPLVVAAREYAEVCRLIDSLQEQMKAHEQELKKLQGAKQEVRTKLLTLIDGPPNAPQGYPSR